MKKSIYRRGFTLLEVLLVIGIIALFVAIAIPNLLRSKTVANETAAQATIKSIATALETYAAANGGFYPNNESVLVNYTPPYLSRSYNGQTIGGYAYSVNINPSGAWGGYSINANRISPQTGTLNYVITASGVIRAITP